MIQALVPHLNVEECLLDLGPEGTYPGIAICLPNEKDAPEGALIMTTIAIVKDQLVVGLHGQGRPTQNVEKPIDVLEDDMRNLIKLMWTNELPN